MTVWHRDASFLTSRCYSSDVRTTVNLDDDNAAAIERLRSDGALGLSETVNDLIRAGLRSKRGRRHFTQRSSKLGLRIDVTNVAEALEELDGPDHR